jgi:hypothetical protein
MWTSKHGALACFGLPSSRRQDRPRFAAARTGSWRATCGQLTCHKWGSGVLQHSARAVVPPPRLRAKWVVFSAPLRTTLGGSGWASGWRCGEVQSLRNPAPRAYFFGRSGYVAVQVEGGYFKKSNFSNHIWAMGWRPRIPWGSVLQKGVTEK